MCHDFSTILRMVKYIVKTALASYDKKGILFKNKISKIWKMRKVKKKRAF